MFLHLFPLLGFLGLSVEQTDDAVGIAYRGNLRVGHDDSGFGMPHGEHRSAFDARRTVADYPIELLAQLCDNLGDAVGGEWVLVAGLRNREQPQTSENRNAD